jgi:hypothetical protein
MDWKHRVAVGMICAAGLALAATVQAQNVTVSAPMVGVSDGFYENIGVGFGFRLPGGGFFNNGGPGALGLPGGVGGGLNGGGGAGLRFGGPNGFFNIVADQGSNRSISSVTPSLTVMNGQTGAIFAGTVRPFVIGITPVVAGVGGAGFSNFGPMPISTVPGPSMLEQRLAGLQETGELDSIIANLAAGGEEQPITVAPPADANAAKLAAARASSAGQPAQSIVAIRRQQAEQDAVRAREIAENLERARQAEAAKKPGVARVYYQQALRQSTGEQREEIEAKLRSLGSGVK